MLLALLQLLAVQAYCLRPSSPLIPLLQGEGNYLHPSPSGEGMETQSTALRVGA
jgi:hypothetical protein